MVPDPLDHPSPSWCMVLGPSTCQQPRSICGMASRRCVSFLLLCHKSPQTQQLKIPWPGIQVKVSCVFCLGSHQAEVKVLSRAVVLPGAQGPLPSMHTHTDTQTHTQRHIQTYTQTHTDTKTHTQVHRDTQRHIQTYTHTDTHRHTRHIHTYR